MIDPPILTSIITGLCVAIPSIIATLLTQNAHEAVQCERLANMNMKIDDLSQKVDKLADFDKRISILEHDIQLLSDKMSKEVRDNE